MKRRNAELGKMRRSMKRNKITEGFYSSCILYLKLFALWMLIILADFILEFRFEYLWPFYLLIRSVYDSFKYQGVAFSVFFVCIALTSDMLCFFFIPVQWLFFVASTYVWIQYVWNTEKAFCPPMIMLCAVFVYLEAMVRLRDVKHIPGHLDLCRPFAAHCIGYPVVTLGFGFKSYVSFRMRQKKQRSVAKENDFYLQLMQQALPVDTTPQIQESSSAVVLSQNVQSKANGRQSHERNGHVPNGTVPNGLHAQHGQKAHRKSVEKVKEEHEKHMDKQKLNHAHTNGVAGVLQEEPTVTADLEPKLTRRREKKEQDKEREASEYLQRIELETKRLRNELQSSRSSEQDLRLQVAALTTSEKVLKGDILTFQHSIEELQTKLQSAQSARSTDRQTISYLERRVQEEKRNRLNYESQVAQERKKFLKQEEVRAAQQAAAQNNRGECTESCKARRRELESEVQECRTTQRWADDRLSVLERENAMFIEKARDVDILRSALETVQEQNTHLENSLSAETRIKLDLFSALGEAKRQLEIRESQNRLQEKEIEELKSKIAQVLAVMPNDTFGNPTPSTSISRVRLAEIPPGSTLDPNATAYTPKNSLVASTEA